MHYEIKLELSENHSIYFATDGVVTPEKVKKVIATYFAGLFKDFNLLDKKGINDLLSTLNQKKEVISQNQTEVKINKQTFSFRIKRIFVMPI